VFTTTPAPGPKSVVCSSTTKSPFWRKSGSRSRFERVMASVTVAFCPPAAGGFVCPDHGEMNMACVVTSIAFDERSNCAKSCVQASKPRPSPARTSGSR
jgi:hypothetical protein